MKLRKPGIYEQLPYVQGRKCVLAEFAVLASGYLKKKCSRRTPGERVRTETERERVKEIRISNHMSNNAVHRQ